MNQLIFILVLFLFNAFIQYLAEGKRTSFTIDLVHRDSPLSPLHNPSATPSELMRKAALRSLNRASFFYSATHINDNKIMSPLTEIEGEYIMKIYIGSSRFESLAIADTGSNLIWTQCGSLRNNHHKNGKFFNPLTSPSYDSVDYNSEFCQALRKKWIEFSNSCGYNQTYLDGSYTTGILGNDTISLNKTSNEVTDFPGVVFGCSQKNDLKEANFSIQGIVGLGPGLLSLISQMKTEIEARFSYCLVPRTLAITSKLIFGVGAKISERQVVSTPLIPDDPFAHYYVELGSVSIGKERTSTDRPPVNVMIDSGTTLTLLHTSLYNDFKVLVKNAIGGTPIVHPPTGYDLCYEVQSINLDDLPEIVFHFTSADLRLKQEHTFATDEGNLTCMIIIPNDHISILGSMAQVNFQVEFDLQNKQVSFAEVECATF